MHADCGRSEGVGGREEEGTPVLAVVVGGLRWAGYNVVPF